MQISLDPSQRILHLGLKEQGDLSSTTMYRQLTLQKILITKKRRLLKLNTRVPMYRHRIYSGRLFGFERRALYLVHNAQLSHTAPQLSLLMNGLLLEGQRNDLRLLPLPAK